jgi:hypothetical protein
MFSHLAILLPTLTLGEIPPCSVYYSLVIGSSLSGSLFSNDIDVSPISYLDSIMNGTDPVLS